MSTSKKTINFQNIHFMAKLRKIELCDFDLYPEPDDSELDWPIADKVDFYIQAYALNSMEALLRKKLTFEQFQIAFENKLVVKTKSISREYFYDEVRLFSEGIKADEHENLYYQIQI